MKTPKFNNRPNDHVSYWFESEHTGVKVRQDFWVCRACAIVGIVLAKTPSGMKILITKRSNKMRDEAGKYGVPCGYLDWDENGYEAMTREIYEETSLYLPEYKQFLIENNNEQPFAIHDSPTRNSRQNVSLIYLSVYDFMTRMDLFPNGIEKYIDRETAEVKWMLLAEFYSRYEEEYRWAFQHNETIREAVEFFLNKIGTK